MDLASIFSLFFTTEEISFKVIFAYAAVPDFIGQYKHLNTRTNTYKYEVVQGMSTYCKR